MKDTIRLKGQHCVCAAMTCNCQGDEPCGDCAEYGLADMQAELEMSRRPAAEGLFHLRIARMIAVEIGDGTCDGVKLSYRDGRAVPVEV